jgi:hypothetical protein
MHALECESQEAMGRAWMVMYKNFHIRVCTTLCLERLVLQDGTNVRLRSVAL